MDERTGEVRVEGGLDHEAEPSLTVLAIPTDGSPSRRVTVRVLDENDNSPAFPVPRVQLDVSEYAQPGAVLALPAAEDPDSPPFDVQKYAVTAGNVNNVFRLQSRSVQGRLSADLLVNGRLDREYRDHYNILVEATDGGEPPR